MIVAARTCPSPFARDYLSSTGASLKFTDAAAFLSEVKQRIIPAASVAKGA